MAKVIEFLHTQELSETVADGGSAATRKNHRVLPSDEEISLAAIQLCGLRGNMTFIPTQSGFMCLEDSEKLLRTIFPKYPSLQPCHRVLSLEPIAQSIGACCPHP